MFNRDYRPYPAYVQIRCNYEHLPYRFRQRMQKIQYEVLQIRQLSKNPSIRLYLFDDDCALVDTINNKILCTYNYFYSSMAVLSALLTEVKQFYEYEKNRDKLKTLIEFNHYKHLKKKFYGC